MPLEKSKSKEAFEHNIKAEVAAGKPVKQAVAIAYSEKSEAGKKHPDAKAEATHSTHEHTHHMEHPAHENVGGIIGKHPKY